MNRVVEFLLLVAIWVVCFSSLPAHVHGDSPRVVGWVENACIRTCQLILPAKIDTGAVTCSLHAPDLVEFERDGAKWVRLTVVDPGGKSAAIEQKIVSVCKIKRHFGHFQERPVIRLTICVGNVLKTSEVNLVDRTGLEYPLLIGRNFMDGSMIVNPSAKFTVEPICVGD